MKSDDTLFTAGALKRFGISVNERDDGFIVTGSSGVLQSSKAPVYLGNSGTSMRFLTALAAIGNGRYYLTGNQRMQERPIQDLVDGLSQIGVSIFTVNDNGCPPIEVEGGKVMGDRIALNCEKSSQYLSALLMIAPYTSRGLDIHVTKGPVSRPYIDMTLDVMNTFGVTVHRDGYQNFEIPGNQIYRKGTYTVEADGSQAGYFFAAAAITGSKITVKGITRHSMQGDVRLLQLLEEMGCIVTYLSDGICVQGAALSAIETDMADMPDMVPTLAVVAVFAKGTTHIKNVMHLKLKESDRLAAVVSELTKMGIKAQNTDTGISIKGDTPCGAVIDTYDDHRIAMSFALVGLVVPNIIIKNERCVDKSFPDFWNVLKDL